MKPIRIYEYHDWAGAGYLLEFLEGQGAPCEVVPVAAESPLSDELDRLGGLVFLGADYSVNDPYPSTISQLKIIHKAMEMKMPILGHCFGAQLISKALGGRVTPMPDWEIGWFQARCGAKAPENLARLIQDGREPVLMWHKEKLEAPPSAKPLFGTRRCPNQAFVCSSNVFAFMAHFEATPEIVRGWVGRFKDKVPLPQRHSALPGVQSVRDLLDDIDGKSMAMHRFAESFYKLWLTQVSAYQNG